MSAGQLPRKRPTNPPPPPDHHRSRQKRPRLDSPPLSLSTHVRLRWDAASSQVVPAKEQIGIPWSLLGPFVDAPPRRRASRLADVAPVPPQIFSPGNLRRVLSYEVWDKFLTEPDRKFLAQFLPIGTDTEEMVRALLTGKNHHFGNPLLTWSSALCYGDLHPDAVLNKEWQIRADKKAYRVHLSDFYSDWNKGMWRDGDNDEGMWR